MRTIETKLFEFNELSDESKENALNEIRENHIFIGHIIDDAHETFLEFCKIFPVVWSNMDYEDSYRSEFSINLEDSILDLNGIRLQKYIWNNFKKYLYKGKYYGCVENDIKYNHPRVKSRELTSAGRLKNWHNPYFSAITLDNSCVLTGVCYDDSILEPIYDFLNGTPNNNIDFDTLLNDCINSLLSDVQLEIDYRYSDKGIIDQILGNEYEFDENGKLF